MRICSSVIAQNGGVGERGNYNIVSVCLKSTQNSPNSTSKGAVLLEKVCAVVSLLLNHTCTKGLSPTHMRDLFCFLVSLLRACGG